MTTPQANSGSPEPGGASSGLATPDRLPVIAGRLGMIVAAVGGIILVGWAADLPLLRSLIPHQVEAKPNTGMAFLLAGTALWLKARGRARPLAILGAALAAALGLATLAQYLTGANWGIDELLFKDVPNPVDTVHAGRMAPPTALNFLLLGAAMLLPGARGKRVGAWLTLAAGVVAAVGFAGSLYGLPQLLSFGPFTAMAAPTGVTFLVLSAGVLLLIEPGILARMRGSMQTAGFVGAMLLLLLLAGAVGRNTQLLIQGSQRVVHTHEVLRRLLALLSTMQEVETSARGYLLGGDTRFLERYQPSAEAAVRLQDELRELTSDNPAQQQRLAVLAKLIDAKLEIAQLQVSSRQQGGVDYARQTEINTEGKRRMDAVRRALDAMLAEEEGLLQERQRRTEANTVRSLLTLGLGLAASGAGLVASFVLLRREVAARTRLAEALRRSEEELRVTLGSIGDGVLATDTAGRVTLLNPVAERLTGWPIAEARGRPVAEIFHIVHEVTRTPARIPVDEVLATGEIRELANHTVLIARDGTERAIADSAAPIRDGAGRLHGAVLVFRDVTESRRAQAQLDRFFELSLDFLCIASPDGYFKRASPAVTDILGWSVAEFLAMPYLEQVHPDDRAATQREVERQMQAGEKVLHFENRYRHKDGSWRVLAWRSAPFGGLMYATARDVTETRQQEERILTLNTQLEQRARQLEASNQELEAFSYSVSHDLRAPLRHVQGYVEMLAREAQGGLSDKAGRYLRTIADAAREMGQLIDDLLAFSRMNRTALQERVVDLAALAAEVRRSLEPAAAGRDIHWSVADLPPVRGDAAMLRQVLVNLLGNAVKYTRRRAQAEITFSCTGTEEGRLVFCVRDNGAGFDMRYADKLFGVFQRLHRADEFEGTGIGLASVRRIIARHGGRTWAEGVVEAGAAIYFTLPPAAAGPGRLAPTL